MYYKPNYIGYELGYYLLPKYKGYKNCDFFFVLLQNPYPDENAEQFSVKLGKTRSLDGKFYADCKKVLVYLTIDDGVFTVYDIELKRKKDGTLFFDAVAFLEQLNIEYEMRDTSNYRHFKARLDEKKLELILQDDNSQVSIIHRRICADDVETIKDYKNNKIKSLLQKGYFLIVYASDHRINYHTVEYFRSENDVKEYIYNNYSGTAGEIVTTYSISELLQGQCYQLGSRFGTCKSNVHIVLVHDANLPFLYRFIDGTERENGEKIILSEHLKTAMNETEIKRIIDIYNDLQENYW